MVATTHTAASAIRYSRPLQPLRQQEHEWSDHARDDEADQDIKHPHER